MEGRTADDAAYWLAGATPAWRDAVPVVCIDLCSIYASAVRRMLHPDRPPIPGRDTEAITSVTVTGRQPGAG